MSYASIAFAYFVLAALVIYYVLPVRFRYLVLLVFSYVFYVMACGKYVIYMLVTTATTYFAGVLMQNGSDSLKAFLAENKGLSREEKKARREAAKSKSRRIMVMTLVLNFGILAVLKYADFTVANVNLLRLHLFHTTDFFRVPSFVLPLGISFYTFQSMGYVIDLYYGKYEAQRNPLKLALYVSFFPQIIQGPISRYDELSRTLFEGGEPSSGASRHLSSLRFGPRRSDVPRTSCAPKGEGSADPHPALRATCLRFASVRADQASPGRLAPHGEKADTGADAGSPHPAADAGSPHPALRATFSQREKALCEGGYRVLWGLFKKLIVADRVAAFVERAADGYASLNGTYLLLMIFFYSVQIYGDFSGGIDITIGVARMFGIRVAENFERPFFSKSVAEYWRRWHITLGTWFKDYIFYPITVSKGVLNLSKKVREKVSEQVGKRIPIYLAMFLVWFTTGLWHGAQWRYVIWGLLNFVILVFSTEAEPLYAKLNGLLKWEGSFPQKCFRVVRTFWIMSFLRVFDVSTQGVSQALVIIKKALFDHGPVSLAGIEELGLDQQELYAALVGIAIMIIFSLVQRKGSITDRLLAMKTAPRWAITALLVMAVVIFGSYGMGYDARAFIYLQF